MYIYLPFFLRIFLRIYIYIMNPKKPPKYMSPYYLFLYSI